MDPPLQPLPRSVTLDAVPTIYGGSAGDVISSPYIHTHRGNEPNGADPMTSSVDAGLATLAEAADEGGSGVLALYREERKRKRSNRLGNLHVISDNLLLSRMSLQGH